MCRMRSDRVLNRASTTRPDSGASVPPSGDVKAQRTFEARRLLRGGGPLGGGNHSICDASRVANSEHGARRSPNHVLCDASQQHVRNAAAASRPHDNQIVTAVHSQLDDSARGAAVDDLRADDN